MAAQLDNDAPRRRGMRINSRLIGLLIVPLAVLTVMTGFGVVQGVTQSSRAGEVADRTALASGAYELVDALEVERSSLVAESTSTPDQQADVRAAAEQLAARAEQVGGALQRETEAVLRRIRGVELLSGRELGGRSALRSYSVTIDELLDLATRAIDPAGAVDGTAASTTDYLARSQAASSQEFDLVTVLRAEGAIDAVSFQELSSLAASQRAYSTLAAETAPTDVAIRIRQVAFAISAADDLRRDAFVATVTPGFVGWLDGLETRTAALAELRDAAETQAVAAVDDLSASSRVLLVVSSLAMIAILLISVLLLRRANRSIARPLQDLARQAEDVATHRLPEAVRAQQGAGADQVHLPAVRAAGAAEVHEVAAAFNDVQDTALRLAVEQAALRVNQSEAMTNLGRRNQTLLARQLDFITSLETRETDPEFLEHLFKLDHLASRMRRNAESLLILAGSETPRRRRSPAPVAEVVRAAMSEVEEFERVRIGSLSDATVAGPVVIDLVHLLAELIENALNFSPPDTTVEIDGRTLGQGGYQFAVIDRGVGMTDVELLSANHRIRGLDELEGMPTRYLGQYVVAKLAGKTGAMVNLQRSSGGRGVTALVNLPADALIGPADRGVAGSPLPGSRAARDSGPAPFAPGAGLNTAVPDEPAPVDLTDAGASQHHDGDPVHAEVAGVMDDQPDVPLAFDVPDVHAPSVFDEPEPGPPPAGVPAAGTAPALPVRSRHTDEAVGDAHVTDAHVADAHVADAHVADAHLAEQGGDATVSPFASAPSFLPADEGAGGDPWAAFRDDAADLEELAASGSDAATLADEADEADEAAEADETALGAERPTPPPVPAPPSAPAQTSWLPLDEAAPATAHDEPARAGGLARRVPGATLAQQRGDDAATTHPAPTRSADGVRSMLSSFQAGRSRGRGGAHPAAGPADPAGAATAVHDPNQPSDPAATSAESDAHHGRSPQ